MDLKEQLDALHAELSSTSEMDAELRARLEAVAEDIRKLLEGEEGGEPHTLRERLAEFETAHPNLAELIGRLSNTLAEMGI